jgi:glycerophosphoryl diester phosphodiesterase
MRKSILVTIAMILSSCQMGSSDDFLVIGHRGAMGYVTENTIASVEKAIDLGVSIVQDILKAVDGRISLNIELKGANTAAKVNQIINYYSLHQGWNLDQFVISSFRWDELEKMRELNPEVAIAVLTEKDPLNAISMAEKLGAIAINPWYKNLTREAVDAIHQKGFKVYTYTVNEAEDIAKMKAMGVDGIFCNYPDRAL